MVHSSSYGVTAQIRPWPPILRFFNHAQLDTVGLLWTSDQAVAASVVH
jgi:hypothetical protein